MPCNNKPTNCAPCGDCPPAPDPLLPRCDVVLTNGVFTNATVAVENGCITSVQKGTPFVYAPESCCSGGGGSQGPMGPQGPAGPAGAAATVAVGTVTTGAPGSNAMVTNSGTSSAAILNFTIPRGADGSNGGGSTTGVSTTAGGWTITDGVVKAIPSASWPPVVAITGSTDAPSSLTFVPSKDPFGVVNLQLVGFPAFISSLENTMDSKDQAVQAALMSQITALQSQLTALSNRVDACGCP